MEKFIPYEKLSKKEKRRRNAAMRGDWGALSPVTRREKNPKAYDRRKAQRSEPTGCAFVFAVQYRSWAKHRLCPAQLSLRIKRWFSSVLQKIGIICPDST